MSMKEATPQECNQLIESKGYVYLDVRTEPEFEMGHPEGAYNIPVLVRDPGTMQMVPNPNFVAEVEANFPKETKFVLGCRSGARSARAQAMLEGAGYQETVNNLHGWEGRNDGLGGVLPGWSSAAELGVETGHPEGRSYQSMKK